MVMVVLSYTIIRAITYNETTIMEYDTLSLRKLKMSFHW